MARRSKLIQIDPSEIILNENNPNVMDAKEYNALVRAIKGDGKLSSLPLCRKSKGKVYMVDGHHRLQAYLEAGLTEPLDVILMDLSDKEAKLRGLGMNNIHGRPDEALLGELLEELKTEYPLDELSALTAYTEDYIEDLINNTEEDVDIPLATDVDGELGDLNDIPSSKDKFVTLRFRVAADAADVINKGIAVAIKELHPDAKNPSGQALELIIGDYLAGAKKEGEEGA